MLKYKGHHMTTTFNNQNLKKKCKTCNINCFANPGFLACAHACITSLKDHLRILEKGMILRLSNPTCPALSTSLFPMSKGTHSCMLQAEAFAVEGTDCSLSHSCTLQAEAFAVEGTDCSLSHSCMLQAEAFADKGTDCSLSFKSNFCKPNSQFGCIGTFTLDG